MRHLLTVIALVGVWALPTFASAQDLILKRVMLSSGGLGYFEYEASVDGEAKLKLTVPLDQVDDVLKSLVVYDDKGNVGGLSLPGRDPLKQLFKDLPFDQAALDSPAALLSALKGTEISVRGSRVITGRIVAVDEDNVPGADNRPAAKRTRVTLMTDGGLQQFILEDAENLQFVDPALRDRLGQALLDIQANRAKDARTLDLSVRGEGTRTVRVAYIVAVPVWKTSYRLTLPPDAGTPRVAVQGWATLENMSGRDWKDVELTLASGRPVAFHQALYEAYYAHRPEIPVEVAGRLMPSVDHGGVAAEAAPAPPPAAVPGMRLQAPKAMTAAPAMAAAADQLEANEAATQVTFKFPRPVSVANGRTLSIPILDREMTGQRIALYQPETAARNPLAAVRLTNEGETGLPPGILTIYQRGKSNEITYVGDARLSAMPIGETRLLPYALDEKITIEREAGQSERVASGSIVNGILRYARIGRQTTTYRIRGPARETRDLIVTERRLPGWTLVKPEAKGVEISEGNYRLLFKLAGGEQTQVFDVVQERTQEQDLRLIDGAADQIKVFASAQDFDAKTREALTKILQLQQAVAEAQRPLGQIEAQQQQLVQEQARIRANLASVPANSDLQRRYLSMLDKQENDLDGLAKQRAEAQKAVDAARDALRAYVGKLG
ncbi:protein of unknown function [Enhydrobacter aerosaccus]|uniref:DUF4139 domain-containing protein n=1 Tax=Enhydrobacter aerosaccus TaxID=225324 RepID=A0A1T4L3X3_9HYPH|nr:DUF4139 domain-containing protein [Enhydrobacter aerosaccus]SJZ49251.1 protein of unknown function [Enhydrobacter aerosaccus]